MKINNAEINKIKEKFKEVGFNGKISDDFCYYLKKKHFSRYIDLIKWLRVNEISVNEVTLNQIYRIDVVIRRMISEILKPIELEVQAHISYYLEFNNIGKKSIISGLIYENIDQFTNTSLYDKKIKTIKFVNNAFIKIDQKKIYKIICEFTFGQLSSFVSILKPTIISKIFSNKFSKDKIIKTMDSIVSLRNHIAHHNLIFTTKKFLVNKFPFTFKEIIKSLSLLVNGNYLEVLENKINKYQNNHFKNNNYSNEKDFDNISKIFEKIKLYLI